MTQIPENVIKAFKLLEKPKKLPKKIKKRYVRALLRFLKKQAREIFRAT